MNRSANQVDWTRLEEVGDLHFHASAYSSALDYYRQLLDDRVLVQLPLLRALSVLRKAVDSNILLGQYRKVEKYILTAMELISSVISVANDGKSRPRGANSRPMAASMRRRSVLTNQPKLLSRARFALLLSFAVNSIAL